MHTLINQLHGQTLQSLRGERRRRDVAERGEIPLSTWRDWVAGRCLPRPSQESRIITALNCSPLRLELTFLAIARARLEQHKRDRLRQVVESQAEDADLAANFEKVMTLQQAALESYESLAAGLGLMERITNARPFIILERSDAG